MSINNAAAREAAWGSNLLVFYQDIFCLFSRITVDQLMQKQNFPLTAAPVQEIQNPSTVLSQPLITMTMNALTRHSSLAH